MEKQGVARKCRYQPENAKRPALLAKCDRGATIRRPEALEKPIYTLQGVYREGDWSRGRLFVVSLTGLPEVRRGSVHVSAAAPHFAQV